MHEGKGKFSPSDSSNHDRWTATALRSLNFSGTSSFKESLVRSYSSENQPDTSPSPSAIPTSPSLTEVTDALPSPVPPIRQASSLESLVRVKPQGASTPAPFRLTSGLAVYLVLAVSLSLNSLWILSSALLSPMLGQGRGSTRWRNALSNTLRIHSDPFDSEKFIPPQELDRLVLGSKDCGRGALIELKSQLQELVLTLYFNDDTVARNSSLFLKTIYGRFFRAVVVIGPSAVPELGIDGRVGHNWGNLSGSGLEEALRASTSSNVGPWSFTSGSFSYFSFPKVVAMHPEAEGYLWLEDGAILNYWQLIRGNKTKLWLTDMPECLRCQGFVPFDHTIHPTVYDGWAGHPAVRKRARNAYSRLPERHQRQFVRSLWKQVNVTSFPKRVVDAFYVPKRFALQLAFDIIPAFREYGVVPEIALPTMFYALEDPQQFDAVLERADHRMEMPVPKYDAAALWTPYVSVFYHWHLASQKEKDKLLRAFSVADSCLLQLLTNTNGTVGENGS